MKSGNLVDTVRFRAQGGAGGDGAISFRREKYIPKGGPDGGNGGDGGHIILRVNEQLSTLMWYAGKDRFEAESGGRGNKRKRMGEDASHLVLEVPAGVEVWLSLANYRPLRGRLFYGDDMATRMESGQKMDQVPYVDVAERWGLDSQEVLRISQQAVERKNDQLPSTNEQANEQLPSSNEQLHGTLHTAHDSWVKVADLINPGDEIVLAAGGRGGLGNDAYKSSRYTTPRIAQRGEEGEMWQVKLELKLLADVALVGLPNVGKSTLLSVLTAARPKIADYHFTTLAPNLGVMEAHGRQVLLADIPGLIEDAHEGRGLGLRFLKHVERCKTLVYVLAPDPGLQTEAAKNPSHKSARQIAEALWGQLMTVKGEVKEYEAQLEHKASMVVVNKADMIEDSSEVIQEYFEQKGIKILVVSAAARTGMDELIAELLTLA